MELRIIAVAGAALLAALGPKEVLCRERAPVAPYSRNQPTVWTGPSSRVWRRAGLDLVSQHGVLIV